MKDDIKRLKTQALAIVLSAGAAALVTFFQVLATSGGLCPPMESSTTEAGILGATFKAAHSVFSVITHKTLI